MSLRREDNSDNEHENLVWKQVVTGHTVAILTMTRYLLSVVNYVGTRNSLQAYMLIRHAKSRGHCRCVAVLELDARC